MPLEVAQAASRAIDTRMFPGCVVGCVMRTCERSMTAFGQTEYGGEDVTGTTVYDLASVTKSIPLASLVSILMEEEKISLRDVVARYVPELHNHFDATLEDLLRYRVRGPRMAALRYRTFEEIRTHMLEHGFDAPPGESAYSNMPAYILGIVLERAAGEALPVLAHRHLFEPLGMNATTFFPAPSDCAPTEIDGRGIVRGLPHDESAYVFARARRAAGHAGLFSTADDLLNFLEAMLRGEYSAVARGAQSGLGWQVSDVHFMGKFAGPKTFGKTGFTGTSVVCDIERGIAFVILSNRTFPKRPMTDDAIFGFRRSVADIFLR